MEKIRMGFETTLRKWFRFSKDSDNLPLLVSSYRKSVKHGRNALAAVMNDLEYKNGVEIGTRKGASAKLWCTENPNLALTCIDPWLGDKRHWSQKRQDINYQIALENLAPYNIEILKMKSMEAIDRFEDSSLDFVYIDGNHEFDYCCPDIIYWSYKVRPGGMVIVHDYCSFQLSGVMQAVNAYTHCHHIDPWYVTRERTPAAFWMKS